MLQPSSTGVEGVWNTGRALPVVMMLEYITYAGLIGKMPQVSIG